MDHKVLKHWLTYSSGVKAKHSTVRAKGLLIKDKAKVRDIQCKPESAYRCSANLTTIYHRI